MQSDQGNTRKMGFALVIGFLCAHFTMAENTVEKKTTGYAQGGPVTLEGQASASDSSTAKNGFVEKPIPFAFPSNQSKDSTNLKGPPVKKSRADTAIIVKHQFNHREQIITGAVIMSCLAGMLVFMNNYNPQ